MNKFLRFNEFFELGNLFLDCEAYLIALEYFNKAIALSSLPIHRERLVNTYELRGVTKRFLGRYLESISDYSKSIELDPKNSYLYFGRAVSYECLNQNEEALKNFKLSLMLDPDFSLALGMVDYLENEKK